MRDGGVWAMSPRRRLTKRGSMRIPQMRWHPPGLTRVRPFPLASWPSARPEGCAAPVVSENSAGPDPVTGSGMRHGTIGP
jgi:hypothetical protein